MITITTSTLIIIILVIATAVGWWLAWKENNLRNEEKSAAEAALNAIVESHEKEILEVEDLVKAKISEISSGYAQALTEANESLELYESYIKNFDAAITLTGKKLEEIDLKGMFSSDDEIGFFFLVVKDLQSVLNKFKIEKELLDSKHEDDVKEDN